MSGKPTSTTGKSSSPLLSSWTTESTRKPSGADTWRPYQKFCRAACAARGPVLHENRSNLRDQTVAFSANCGCLLAIQGVSCLISTLALLRSSQNRAREYSRTEPRNSNVNSLVCSALPEACSGGL